MRAHHLFGVTLGVVAVGLLACLPFRNDGTYKCVGNACSAADAGADGGSSSVDCTASWCPVTLPTGAYGQNVSPPAFYAGQAFETGEVFLVGERGLNYVRHADGGWTFGNAQYSYTLDDVWGADPEHVFAAGADEGAMYGFAQSGPWMRLSNVSRPYLSVRGLSPTEVWACDFGDGVYGLDAGQFTLSAHLNDVFGVSGDDAFVGYALTETREHEVYVVGQNTYAARRYTDGGWVSEPLNSETGSPWEFLEDVQGRLWVSNGGRFNVRETDGGWHDVYPTDTESADLKGLWGDATTLYAVAGRNVLSHDVSDADERHWKLEFSATANLDTPDAGLDVIVGNATDLWTAGNFAGDGGFILYHHHR